MHMGAAQLERCRYIPDTGDNAQDLIPYLVRHQHSLALRPAAALLARTSSEGLGSSNSVGQDSSRATGAAGVGLSPEVLADLLHSPPQHRGQAWLCQPFIAPRESYCIRACTLAAYGDANRCRPGQPSAHATM